MQMWKSLADKALPRLIRQGAIEIIFADGTKAHYGARGAEAVRITITDPDFPRRVIMTPDLAVGEAYMDGTLTIENDDLRGFLTVVLQNRGAGHMPPLMRLGQNIARPVQRWLAHNPVLASRRNVAHHYDLSAELYDLFLDADRQYSCAYFREPGMTLDAAQAAKKQHIAAKLRLRPDMRVLDIGCGWGGMALTLAKEFGVRVVGVTLSEEQHRMACDRVAAAGLSDRIDIRMQDYRDVEGPFDRIVSVGMFEHVGAPHFRTYFDKVRRMLTADGIALIHTIGSAAPPRATSAWVRRHIFPGGYIPSMSETVAAVEKSGLTITDVEVLRLHYAQTLRHWSDRFNAQLDKARALYDDRFVRMWRYYLMAAELSFSVEKLAVFQFQIARDKTAVPITRDYLYPDHTIAQDQRHAAE